MLSGGIVVNPGDIIIGDDDSVVVVPLAFAEDILAKAGERQRMEHYRADGFRDGDQALVILYGGNWAEPRTAKMLESTRSLNLAKPSF